MINLDLSELKGNGILKSAFSSSVTSNRVPHTWLIEGPEGSGKHTFATMFCRVMMCLSDNKPCGTCSNCKRIDAGHIDVHNIVPKDGNKTVGVNEIRAIKDELYVNPISAPCKVYILENAETMTSQAQNALLKMAEEPPENVYFLLLTQNRHMLLQTILSRAVCYSMAPLTVEEAKEVLGKVRGADEEKIATALRLSGGYVGVAKEFLKGETLVKDIAATSEFLNALANGSEYDIMLAGSPLVEGKEKIKGMLTAMASGISDAIHIKAGIKESMKMPLENTEKKVAEAVGYETLVNVYKLINDAIGALSYYANVNITVTALMMRIAQVRKINN